MRTAQIPKAERRDTRVQQILICLLTMGLWSCPAKTICTYHRLPALVGNSSRLRCLVGRSGVIYDGTRQPLSLWSLKAGGSKEGNLRHQVCGSRSSVVMASASQAPQAVAPDNKDADTVFWQHVQSHQKTAPRLPVVEEVRTLFDQSLRGMLSTFSQKHEGYPSGSMVDFSCDEDGFPILAISELAVHTKDLEACPKCSLLVAKDPTDRTDLVTILYGDAVFVSGNEVEVSRTSYLKKHPEAFWVDFGDFEFVRIEPKIVRYVSGVATGMQASGEFNWEQYRSAKVDPISQFSNPIASHMNKDHAEDTKLIVQHSTAIQVDYAHMIDLDRLGFNVKVGYRGKTIKLRIPFPRPAEDRRDVKNLIVQMLETAKGSSTGTEL